MNVHSYLLLGVLLILSIRASRSLAFNPTGEGGADKGEEGDKTDSNEGRGASEGNSDGAESQRTEKEGGEEEGGEEEGAEEKKSSQLLPL